MPGSPCRGTACCRSPKILPVRPSSATHREPKSFSVSYGRPTPKRSAAECRLFGHHVRTVFGKLRDDGRVEVEVRRDQFGRRVGKPVGEGYFLVALGAEQREEDEVGGAGILHIVAEPL